MLPHACDPAALSADQDGLTVFGDRVDHIVAQRGYGTDASVAKPVQTSARGREPHTIGGVADHRSDAASHDRVDARVRHECAVAPAFDAAGVADPQVAFTILEHRRHRRRWVTPLERHRAVRVDANQPVGGADPDVGVAIRGHRECPRAGGLGRHGSAGHAAARPSKHTVVGANPESVALVGHQAVDFLVHKYVGEGRGTTTLHAHEPGVARPEPDVAVGCLRDCRDERSRQRIPREHRVDLSGTRHEQAQPRVGDENRAVAT